jgi:MoaA/NifB/PqqE/SkfB family radical SAM enzyme
MASNILMSSVYPQLQSKLATASTARVAGLQRKIIGFLSPDLPVSMHHHIKALWHKERIGSVLAGEAQTVTPVTVEFVPSLDCNLACLKCTYLDWKARTAPDRGKRKMSYPMMVTLLDKIAANKIGGVIFTGGGEPFENPHTIDGIEYAVSQHLDVGIFTNGSLLDEAKIERLAASGPRFVRVSLNSGEANNYCRFHGVKDRRILDTVKTNVRLLAKALTGKETSFGLGFIVDETNVDYMESIALFVRQIYEEEGTVNLSYIGYRPVVNYGQIEADLTAQIHPAVAESAGRNYEKIRQILAGLPVTPIFASDYFESASQGRIGLQREYQGCPGHPWAASVAYDGGVYLCSEHDGDPRFLMGNLMTQTWTDIWHSAQRQQVISHIGLCPPTCKVHRTNLLLAALVSEGSLSSEEISEMQSFLDLIRGAGDPGGFNFI